MRGREAQQGRAPARGHGVGVRLVAGPPGRRQGLHEAAAERHGDPQRRAVELAAEVVEALEAAEEGDTVAVASHSESPVSHRPSLVDLFAEAEDDLKKC